MRLTAWLLPLTCLVLVTALWAGEPTRAVAPAPTVEQWIERLGSPDYRQRGEASRALAALGVPALPALRKALPHPDPEVRRRLEELVGTLEAKAAMAPKLVSLRIVNRPLKEVLAELS